MKPRAQASPQRVVYRPSTSTSTNHNLEITRNNVGVMEALHRIKTNVARAQNLIDGTVSGDNSSRSLSSSTRSMQTQNSSTHVVDRRRMFTRVASDDSITVTVWPATQNSNVGHSRCVEDDDVFVLPRMRPAPEINPTKDEKLSGQMSQASCNSRSNQRRKAGKLVQNYDLRSNAGMDLLQRLERHISKWASMAMNILVQWCAMFVSLVV